MYRLKLKRSTEASLKSEFLGNKTLIRRYRQRRGGGGGGQRRHRTNKSDDNPDVAATAYDIVKVSDDDDEDLVPLLEPRKFSSLPSPSTHHSTRSHRRSGRHQPGGYNSPCRLVTMLVV
ncbi:unnamed protein product [Mesocestoides corti]|uniref:Expressed conserved protein n=1 Tax=Mesocestoides corti TaxID=53468 RepID=A0A0R3UQK1_MESCO|nr:unnamed protein product [Mesocestoides corti]